MVPFRRLALLVALGAIASGAHAVTTSDWTHTSEADFSGKMEAVVASSLGELRLSQELTTLIEQDARFDVVYAVRQLADGSIVVGTGPSGAVMRLAGKSITELYKPGPGTLASALAVAPDGKLLVGISGASARLVRIDPATGESAEILQVPEAQFIWAIQVLPDGSALLGTGPTGRLVQVGPDGKARTVVTLRQHNILSILPLADDMVAVGTDPDGLLIRVNVTTGEWFVLYDAAEPEIVSLCRDKEGVIYAAATSAAASSLAETSDDAEPGRPEATPDVPFRRESPADPKPPELPDPNPGEPEPIPRNTPALKLLIEDAEGDDALAARPSSTQPSTVPAPTRPAASSDDVGNGSAIYRIGPGGYVEEIHRRGSSIHSLVLSGDSLFFGTGPDGRIMELRPQTQELLAIAQTSSRQVSAMSIDKDGQVLAGISNPGGLLMLRPGYAASGVYTSEVLDAEQVANFGMLQLQGTLPAGTAVTVSTRSGNVKDPEAGGWSKWSQEQPAAEFVQIPAPPARFLQYRVKLTTKESSATPVIEEIKVNYVLRNIAPRVNSVTVEAEAADEGMSPSAYRVSWEASDTNEDDLVYALHYRFGHKGNWVLLKDDLKETSFSWNTRQVADGRYQVQVTASDAKSNPAGEALSGKRYSDPVVIDNTAPAIGDVKAQVEGDVATVSLRVVDRTGVVQQVQFAVDSSDDWQAAASSDMLYDSPDETVKFTTVRLAAGAHQITVRARDSSGNAAYETLLIAVDDEKK